MRKKEKVCSMRGCVGAMSDIALEIGLIAIRRLEVV